MNAILFRYVILLTGGFWIDRWTKMIALRTLEVNSVYVNPVMNFSLEWNRGVSFSWFTPETTTGFIALTIGVMTVTALFGLYTWGQYRMGKLLYGQMLVMGGACSNLVDRFKYGAVVDFIDLHIGSWHFATFNFADVCICLGITWLMLVEVKEVYDAYVQKNS